MAEDETKKDETTEAEETPQEEAVEETPAGRRQRLPRSR